VIIKFDNSKFGNKNNQPRLKGNSVYSNKNSTILKKGVFTTCKKRDKCPPWVISAEEIKHNKLKKIINYKKKWLKVYDVPVLYFPKFFHPDPTVKRQSGFLIPTLSNSNNFVFDQHIFLV
jgi:LPS-assembly protein